MSSSPEQRLASWRAVVRDGGPGWLVELAPRIVRQLEAEALAAAARQGGDVQQAPGEAPQSGGDSRNARKDHQGD